MSSPDFYKDCLCRLLKAGLISKDWKVLVVCGGTLDRDVLYEIDFLDVVISNLDEYQLSDQLKPYRWMRADAEDLPFDDGQFNLVIVNAGLHHCASPHHALVEMYRVASKAVFVIESRDSLLMRLAVTCGFASEYEVEAVVRNELKYGGWRNSTTPNYVYRWSEREVVKTIRSYDPTTKGEFCFFYGLRFPLDRFELSRSRIRRVVAGILKHGVNLLISVAPKQGNLFAFFICKTGITQPWLNPDGSINLDYIAGRYHVRSGGRRIRH